MHVQDFFRARPTVAALIIGSGLLMPILNGCHRAPGPDVVATVNGKEISRADLDKYYKNSLGDAPQQPTAEEADIRRLTILHQMIEDEILQQRAAKLSLAASDEDVNTKFTEMKSHFQNEDQFNEQLKARNLTAEDLKRDIRRSLTKTKLLNKEIESKINISDAEISTYYAAHKAEFNLIEPQYHLAQIIVSSMPAQQAGNLQNNKAANDADAKKKILALHNRLESGEDFGALAMNFSENQNTASNGGDMGFVAESALHEQTDVYNAVSKLKPGQITEILPIQNGGHVIGYAIFKLIAREPAGQRELNNPSVQQVIRQGLRDVRAQQLKNAYFEMIHDDAKVHNYLADQILKQGSSN